MPKKILFECAVHQLLAATQDILQGFKCSSEGYLTAISCVDSWEFEYLGPKQMRLSWSLPTPGEIVINYTSAQFYTRGDVENFVTKQKMRDLIDSGYDQICQQNRDFFKALSRQVLNSACNYEERMADKLRTSSSSLLEEVFHDQWATSEDVNSIDVENTFTACTSPELRSITRKLGDLKGKKVLDVGCGLGEASVFFAMRGAEVTAVDLSEQMLQFTKRLATRNCVTLRTHKASAESLNLPVAEKFDIIYVGNLFHHVEIEPTIQLLSRHLKSDGVLTSWDPLAYNPLINCYRRMATDVRTPDEHPLKCKDLNLFKNNFEHVEFQYYWFFTLIIFIIMYLFKGQNPNKVRYWKKVVDDSNYWKPFYGPLELLDRVFLTLFPFMGLLCWNVVIFAKGPKAPNL